MSNPNAYSLEQIRDAVLAERNPLSGVAPNVQPQNELILKMLPVGAALADPGTILGCQLIGSRAHGSAVPESDLDLAILTWDRSRAPATELMQRLRSALFPAGIEVDPKLAASAAGIMTGVPSSPARFIHEIGTKPQRSIGLYEAGVVDTPALRLAALAANEVILAKGGDAQRVWKDWVRPKHTRAYMGDYGRFCIKVAGALEVREAAVSSVITSEVWQERIDRFGLPKQFEEHYEAGQTWLAAQPDIPQEYAHGVALYEQVKAVVAA